jgi:asparagine synthase (glutamine-hydrolysing)
MGMRGRNYMLSTGSGLAESLSYVNLYFDARSRARLTAPLPRSAGRWRPESARTAFLAQGSTTVSAATRMDFQLYLAEDILVKVDRASMLTSLEVRAPFLDHRVVEFAFGAIPDHLKATETQRKIVPRALAARLLPSTLDLDRKQGFSLPLLRWFHGPWGRYLESVLQEAEPAIFDAARIQALIRGQRRGYSNMQRIYSLAIFELWRRAYGIEVPTASTS